jgi:hypothetical protein
MEMADEIARILVREPLDSPGTDSEHKSTPVQVRRNLEARRKEVSGRLRAAGAGTDPLLTTLALLRRQRLEAEMTIRLLVAYGREFVRPRPYRLLDLADAAGMSISGIRTAYGEEEMDHVADALDRRPNRGSTDG